MAHQSYLILESCSVGFGSGEKTLKELELELEIALRIPIGFFPSKVLPCKLLLLFLQPLKRV